MRGRVLPFPNPASATKRGLTSAVHGREALGNEVARKVSHVQAPGVRPERLDDPHGGGLGVIEARVAGPSKIGGLAVGLTVGCGRQGGGLSPALAQRFGSARNLLVAYAAASAQGVDGLFEEACRTTTIATLPSAPTWTPATRSSWPRAARARATSSSASASPPASRAGRCAAF